MILETRGHKSNFEIEGDGEPLLLLHGFSGSSLDWETIGKDWGEFQLIMPDLRGHGGSENPSEVFYHSEAAEDVIAILDHLGIERAKGLGLSAGANVLLHMAAKHPQRVASMIVVSGVPYFPKQARDIMRQYTIASQTAEQQEMLRQRHPGGEAQIEKLMANVRAFAEIYDDMNLTPPFLSRISARTLIVAGDRDPLYPLEIFVEMARAIANSCLWIVPGGAHGPIFGEQKPEFVRVSKEFLKGA